MSPYNITILTLYKEMFPGILGYSLAKTALDKKIWSLRVLDIREFGKGKHKKVDDKVFGGGRGMLMRADILSSAIESTLNEGSSKNLVYLTPKGITLTQELVKQLVRKDGMTIICGHFEGIDQRIIEKYQPLEISIGDYILSGGEVATQVLVDACVRILPGVVNSESSIRDESFENILLEHSQFTKPRHFADLGVPEVLLNGNHRQIKEWQQKSAEELTKTRRTDLWKKYNQAKKLNKGAEND